jgi:hypothetical protein
MTPIRQEIFRLLDEMSRRYPEWRLGQLVANAAMWARQPTDPADTAIWDVEDEELAAALHRHLAGRPATDPASLPSSFQPG